MGPYLTATTLQSLNRLEDHNPAHCSPFLISIFYFHHMVEDYCSHIAVTMDSILYKAAMEGNIGVLMENKDRFEQQVTPTNNTVLHVTAQFHDSANNVPNSNFLKVLTQYNHGL